MYRFAVAQLFCIAAAAALFYFRLWKNYGPDAVSTDFFIYLLQKNLLFPVIKTSLLCVFPPSLLLYIITATGKEKATRIYCFTLNACANFLFIILFLNLADRAVAGGNIAVPYFTAVSDNIKQDNAGRPVTSGTDNSSDDKKSGIIQDSSISEDNKKISGEGTDTGAGTAVSTQTVSISEIQPETPDINEDGIPGRITPGMPASGQTQQETKKHEKKPKTLPRDRTFFGRNYVPASKDIIEPPAKKKNIILIFMESMEQTFSEGKLCGANLIPFLSETASDNITFSNYTDGYATNWTQAALVAATSGLPSSYLTAKADRKKDVNSAAEEIDDWLNGVYTLGEILEDNGYARLFVQGGSLAFSGAKNYLEAHGFRDCAFGADELKGYRKKRTSWGIADRDIYPVFEDKLSKISKKQPFFAVLTTIDTHHYNVPKDTPKVFDMRSKDVIYNADSMMKDFLNRFYLQNYSKDTVLIIVGDHLRMAGGPKSGSGFLKEIPKEQRRIYNAFINSSRDELPLNLQRTFTQIDLFPTILEAAGFNIKGHRLGLGTSVFSEEKTLAEQYGQDELKKKLRRNSPLYGALWE